MLKTYIRFGVQKNKPFLKTSARSYDGIVLPANILLYQYKATPGVIYLTRKPFFVDPMSYLFTEDIEKLKRKAADTSNWLFKPSFEKLCKGHGIEPANIQSWTQGDALRELLTNEHFMRSFVKSSLDFQAKNVAQSKKYIKDIDENLLDDQLNLEPEFLVTPYIKIVGEETLKAMKKIINVSKELSSDKTYSDIPFFCWIKSFQRNFKERI